MKKDGYCTTEILTDLSMWLMVNGLFFITFKMYADWPDVSDVPISRLKCIDLIGSVVM